MWVKQCKRFIKLNARLPAILKGQDKPADAAERLELAELCHYKGLHVSSVRLYTEAFDADAKLAGDFQNVHRWRAACSAALAAAGQGKEAAKLDEEGQARLRRRALEWLRADLVARVAKQLKGGTAGGRSGLEAALRIWQTTPALAGVRDAGPLAALPSADRAGGQKLWADVAATQALARDGQ
jgi:eukaryotic-like serine/threonine-protein kinase